MATANSWDEYIATFTSGKTLGTINGCWILASVKSAEDTSGKWAMTDMPSLTGVDNATNYSNQGGSTWVVTSNCANKDLYNNILPKTGAIGNYLPAADADNYQSEDEFFGGQKIYADIVDYTSHVPEFNKGMYYTEANTALATALTNVCSGGDIDEELKTAEETVNFNMGN